MTDTIETWTARAVAALRRGRDAHRDAILECGRCCYEALRLAVASGRYSYGLRSELARQLSEAAGQKVDVSRYVVCDRIVSLLGSGADLGKLGIAAIRAFYVFLRRARSAPTPGSLLRDRGRRARGEEYEVMPQHAARARELFAAAVRESWTYEQTREAIGEVVEVRRCNRHAPLSPISPPIQNSSTPAEAVLKTGTSVEVFYSDEEAEFLRAMERYRRERKRPFPTCIEVLAVARSLGYRRVAEPDARIA